MSILAALGFKQELNGCDLVEPIEKGAWDPLACIRLVIDRLRLHCWAVDRKSEKRTEPVIVEGVSTKIWRSSTNTIS